MQCRIGDVELYYVEHGTGAPLIALHGSGVDHREIEAALEPFVAETGLRRIYPDLPGMGRSTAHGLQSNEAVVALLASFLDRKGGGPALLVGHSYGAYLARGLAAQRPDLVLGLALVCPLGESSAEVPAAQVVRQDADVYSELRPEQRAGFDEYFVVRTRATARRYRDSVVPGTVLADEDVLGRIFSGWALSLDGPDYSRPTLIVAGRQDSTVGYIDAMRLLGRYPRATLAVIEGGGHALLHERPEPLAALVRDWIDRSRLAEGSPVARDVASWSSCATGGASGIQANSS